MEKVLKTVKEMTEEVKAEEEMAQEAAEEAEMAMPAEKEKRIMPAYYSEKVKAEEVEEVVGLLAEKKKRILFV